MQHSDTKTDIKFLLFQLREKENIFKVGMQTEKEFDEMKKLFLEIKQLKAQIAALKKRDN